MQTSSVYFCVPSLELNELMGCLGGSDSERIWLQRQRPGIDPWVGKNSLEKGMATHSSVLAWRIPWTEEPGGLQFMGSQRFGHN